MESLVKLYPELREDEAEDKDSKKNKPAEDVVMICGSVYVDNPPKPPDKRIIVMNHLKKTNFDMINKMGTLIDLTKKVVKKMKL